MTDVNKDRTPHNELHVCVTAGTLNELRSVLEDYGYIDSPGRFGNTLLMTAIEVRDLEKLKLLIEHGADPEKTNQFQQTALAFAVDNDFVEGIEFLIGLGVDRGYFPKYEQKPSPLPPELRQLLNLPLDEQTATLFNEQQWDEAKAEFQKMLEHRFQNPNILPYIQDVQSVNALQLFLDAGDDLSLADPETRRAYLGLSQSPQFQCSHEDYLQFRAPRFGRQNPEQMNNPFWEDMIRIGCNAYIAKSHFDRSQKSWYEDITWCYERFGSTITPLGDGRFVQIGGEHEDHYDPDFCIYNDVVVHEGNGKLTIYGYPKEIFPPTDFHSATLIGDEIYIIGCLGYDRPDPPNQTPVYKLNLNDWSISKVLTTGKPPAGIHRHYAKWLPEQNEILLWGGQTLQLAKKTKKQAYKYRMNRLQYTFNPQTAVWKKLSPH